MYVPAARGCRDLSDHHSSAPLDSKPPPDLKIRNEGPKKVVVVELECV